MKFPIEQLHIHNLDDLLNSRRFDRSKVLRYVSYEDRLGNAAMPGPGIMNQMMGSNRIILSFLSDFLVIFVFVPSGFIKHGWLENGP